MVYITQNTSIDFIWTTHVNKDYRSNPSTQEDEVTPKQAPELQTVRGTKSGPKNHACKEKPACKDMKKTRAPQSSPYAAPASVAFLPLVFTDALTFWGLGVQQIIRITFWPSASCKKWVSWGYCEIEMWQKPKSRTQKCQCQLEQSECLPCGGGLLHGLKTVCNRESLHFFTCHTELLISSPSGDNHTRNTLRDLSRTGSMALNTSYCSWDQGCTS